LRILRVSKKKDLITVRFLSFNMEREL